MPVRGLYGVVAAEDAEDGDAERVEGLAEHPLVDGGADAVQDDAGDAQFRVEGRVAVDHRGHRAGHRPRVHDEHDWRAEELGDVGGRGELPAAALAVEEAHDALDDRDVGAARAVGEERADQVRARRGTRRGCGPDGPRRGCGRRGL